MIHHMPEVQIIADSISPAGSRIVTFQLRYWRAIHAEVMTHRAFSRNAGSSRARPSAAIIEQVKNEPWGPRHWGANQPGMQAGGEVEDVEAAQRAWLRSAAWAAQHAESLLEQGLHKQIVNRVLEPYTYIDVVLTSTMPGLENFFALRIHSDAQPEIQDLARAMQSALQESAPVKLGYGEWHLPYVDERDIRRLSLSRALKISTARCARVSYKAFDGSVDTDKDLALYKKLVGAHPMHSSPMEHQACAVEQGADGCGNFTGWAQHRKLLERIKQEFPGLRGKEPDFHHILSVLVEQWKCFPAVLGARHMPTSVIYD